MKSYRIILLLLTTTFLSFLASAQAPVDYRDVAVIVNTRSQNSVKVGAYFMQKRKIPKENLIQFAGDTSEEIDSTTFEGIRKSIQDSLKTRKGINYLVTTKGCPLKINHGGKYCDMSGVMIYGWRYFNYSRCASFESELMLILGKNQTHIGIGDVIDVSTTDSNVRTHPYYRQPGSFSRAKYDMFLVTRLDAYTRADVMKLIDRSGPNTMINRDSAKFVLDNMPWSYTNGALGDSMLNHSFLYTYRKLKKDKWNVIYDSSAKLLDTMRNVIGYLSWGYTDPAYKALLKKKPITLSFLGGSVSANYYSYTGRTFISGSTGYKATSAQLFSEGLSSGIAHVYEPITFAMADPLILFGKYTDTTVARRYNMAEAYYSASPTMSWMTTVIGDPKTSIVTHMPAIPAPVVDTVTTVCRNSARTVSSARNAQGNSNWFFTDSASLKSSGQVLDSTNSKWAASGTSFSLPVNIAPGTYTYTYVNENISGRAFRQITYKLVVCTAVEEAAIIPLEFEIYPNPSHGEFTFSFKQQKPQDVKVSLTDLTGRVVLTKNYSHVSEVQEPIDLKACPAGIYFISLSSENGRAVKKIVIH